MLTAHARRANADDAHPPGAICEPRLRDAGHAGAIGVPRGAGTPRDGPGPREDPALFAWMIRLKLPR